MSAITRQRFEEIADEANFGSGVPVITEDGHMGLVNHWNDKTCMVDIYTGNDCATFHVPWSNLNETWLGVFVSLNGAIRA